MVVHTSQVYPAYFLSNWCRGRNQQQTIQKKKTHDSLLLKKCQSHVKSVVKNINNVEMWWHMWERNNAQIKRMTFNMFGAFMKHGIDCDLNTLVLSVWSAMGWFWGKSSSQRRPLSLDKANPKVPSLLPFPLSLICINYSLLYLHV